MVPTGPIGGWGRLSPGLGVLSAQLMTYPEMISHLSSAGAPIARALKSPNVRVRLAALEEADQDPDFQTALHRLQSLVSTGDAGSLNDTTQRQARLFAERLKSNREHAYAQPHLGPFKDLLQRIETEHPQLNSLSLADWRQAGEAPRQLFERYKESAKAAILSFTGSQDINRLSGWRSRHAVERAFNVFYGQVGDVLMKQVIREIYEEALAEQDPALLSQYRHFTDEASLTVEAEHVERQFGEALFDSDERRKAYWELHALKYEMARRDDWDFEAYQNFGLAKTSLQLSETERLRLKTLRHRVAMSVDDANLDLHYDLLDGIETFYRKAQEASLQHESSTRFVYYDVAQELALHALRIGIPTDKIHGIVRLHGSTPQTQPITMSQLQARPIEITPEALPPEVKEALEAVGLWTEVQRAAQRIVLMPDYKSSEQIKQLVGSAPHGRTYFLDGTVVIATQSKDEASGATVNFDPWRIAGLLVHEAIGHLRMIAALGRLMPKNPELARRLLYNIPQEREAYAWETLFYSRYRQVKALALNPNESLELAELAMNTQSIVHACNLLLGVDVNDLEPLRLPALRDEAYAGFSATVDSIDWNVYPARLVAILGRSKPQPQSSQYYEFLDLREKLSEQVTQIEGLMNLKYQFIKVSVLAAIEPLKPFLGEKDYSENDLAGLLWDIAELEADTVRKEKLAAPVREALAEVQEALSLNMDLKQMAIFLAGFEQRIRAQHIAYRQLFENDISAADRAFLREQRRQAQSEPAKSNEN